MRRLSTSLILLGIVLAPVTALAADVPRDWPAEAASQPAYGHATWSGFYVGLNGGFARSQAKSSSSDAILAPFLGSTDDTSFLVGGQVGANWQMNSNFVFGVEADIDYFGGKVEQRVSLGTITTPIDIGATTYNVTVKQPWIATARLRAGFDMDGLLVYGTGGLAGTMYKVEGNLVVERPNNLPANTPTNVTDDVTKWGWTVGVGAEYRLENNLSIKGEYLYADFGSDLTAIPGISATAKSEYTAHIVRLGVNYHF